MPSSAAERQRRRRQRIRDDPARELAEHEKDRKRWHQRKAAGSVKLVGDLSEFIAIRTPPWLCPLLFGGLSLLYTVYRLAGKHSEDDMEGSSQVSVPIMMSGFVVSRSKSSSGFLFFIDWKFKLIIFSGRLTVLPFRFM